ncbi:MAG: 30S ribosomal protein S6 [Planctomycetota bacterium]
MLLLDNREVRKGWDPLKEAVGAIFAKHGAEVVSARRWEERRLAYLINGQSRGTYLVLYYHGDPDQNPAIRRDLDFYEAVLRQMTVAVDEVPAEAHEPEAEFDVNAIPVDDEPAAEAPAADAKGGDAKTGDAKAGEDKSGEDKSGEDKSGEDKAEATAEGGEPVSGEAKAEGETAAVAAAGEETAEKPAEAGETNE